MLVGTKAEPGGIGFHFKSEKTNNRMKIKSAIDTATGSRVNRQAMKKKTLSLAAGFAALFFCSSIASANPVVSSSSENSVQISDAKVVRALGGGSYVTGMIGPSFGYVAPDAAQVHVAAYDANGKLLGEKVDNIDGDDLVRSHYSPNPRAPYTVFFPWAPSQIAKVTVEIQ
jgi:hypothetical protein